MTKTIAGYDRRPPSEVGVPGYDNLDDFSIHEPNIRPGESVSGLEEFIAENSWIEYHSGEKETVICAETLREFMKSKVLVPWLSLRIAHDCLEDFISDYAKTPTDDPETRRRLMQSYSDALKDIQSALHPTSSGGAK